MYRRGSRLVSRANGARNLREPDSNQHEVEKSSC